MYGIGLWSCKINPFLQSSPPPFIFRWMMEPSVCQCSPLCSNRFSSSPAASPPAYREWAPAPSVYHDLDQISPNWTWGRCWILVVEQTIDLYAEGVARWIFFCSLTGSFFFLPFHAFDSSLTVRRYDWSTGVGYVWSTCTKAQRTALTFLRNL